jgi:hypothetical protein
MTTSLALFHDLTCPACGGPGLLADGERVVCNYCGRQFAGARSFCANCQHVNREQAAFCERCGDPLTRPCPACAEMNWIGAEYCGNCGRPLDLLEYLAHRHRVSTAERLRHAQDEARLLKAQEDAASERRSQRLLRADLRRQQAMARLAARQSARDQAVFWMVLAGGLVFGLAVIIVGIIVTGR